MKKKRILIATILMVILVVILILILLQQKQTNKIDDVEETAKAKYTTTIGETEYSIDNLIESNPVPSMSAGMIPVKLDGEKWVITTKDDNSWYDYANGKVAYMMLNDGTYQSELVLDMAGKKLAKDNVGVGLDRPEDIGTVYVWVPRFAYNEGEIVYIKQGCSVAGSWTLPEIFTHKISNENIQDISLSGIWVEYNPLANSSAVNTKVSDMQGEDNKYGLIANAIGVNGTNETTYQETIAKFVGEYNCTLDTTNLNRTILKIVNTNFVEPMKAKAYYDESDEKIKIEVTYNKNTITKILGAEGNVLGENSMLADTGDEVIGNKSYKYIIIDNIGNLKAVTVEVTGLDVYIIENEEDLKLFRKAVNSNKTNVNTKAYQIADVKMNEGKYTKAEDGTVTFNSDAETWIPIGTSSYNFKGKYYGNNYTISGIYINNNAKSQGLFYSIDGASIDDLGIINSKIKGGQYTGSIIGQMNGNSKLNHCFSEATIDCNANNIGGIVRTYIRN